MKPRPGLAPLAVILLASTLALIARITVIREREAFPPLPSFRVGLPPEYLKLAALSFSGMAADVLWIRFIQEIPLHPAEEAQGRALASELTAVTRLDPHFRAAYLHGAILLSVLGNQPCSALGLLEEGARRFPTDFQLPFEAGYNCFSELGDLTCAAEYMKRASLLPRSPRWLPGLVGRLMAESSQGEAAVEYLAARVESEPDPGLRARFTERLGQAILARDIESLQADVRKWRLNHDGELPSSLEVLVADGTRPSLPPEPFHGRYLLRPDGKVVNEDPAHETPLRTYRRDSSLTGDIRERLLEERVEGRRDEVLGKPWWLQSPLDDLATRGGVLEQALQGLENLASFDPANRFPLRVGEARVLLEHDLRRLGAAALTLRREDPSSAPSLPEIEARAGVPDHDVFGSPYRLDSSGMPATSGGRPRLVVVRPGRGGSPCL